jgi:hypothetical protein
MLRVFNDIEKKIIKYGSTKNINISFADKEKVILKSKPKFVLLPNEPIKNYWNIFTVFLLAYVAIIIPYTTCFLSSSKEWTLVSVIDLIVDIMFLFDIIINFISAYEDTYTGLLVVQYKKIAYNYISSWFFIDLIASIPT